MKRQEEFERFIETHGPGLVKLAYNICGDRERAEDAVQEASVRVFLKWSRLEDPLAYARRRPRRRSSLTSATP